MTVEEFRGVHGTIKNLVHNGKEERKIYRAGEAAEFAELLPQFLGSIKDAAHDKFAKLGKGENITTDVLIKICESMNCHLEDIMETIQDDES